MDWDKERIRYNIVTAIIWIIALIIITSIIYVILNWPDPDPRFQELNIYGEDGQDIYQIPLSEYDEIPLLIVDEDDNPVEGVTVTASGMGVSEVSETGENGIAIIPLTDAILLGNELSGSISIEANYPGYPSYRIEIIIIQ